jgi:hypothetical protein
MMSMLLLLSPGIREGFFSSNRYARRKNKDIVPSLETTSRVQFIPKKFYITSQRPFAPIITYYTLFANPRGKQEFIFSVALILRNYYLFISLRQAVNCQSVIAGLNKPFAAQESKVQLFIIFLNYEEF